MISLTYEIFLKMKKQTKKQFVEADNRSAVIRGKVKGVNCMVTDGNFWW